MRGREWARRGWLRTPNIANRRQFSRIAALAAGLRLTPSFAQLVDKYAEQLQNGEFNWDPERSPGGPVLIIVSLPDHLVYLYRNGVRIAASTCSTGKLGHRTPTGVFKILQKDKNHHSFDLQQCADALYEPAHMVGRRAACGTTARLPRFARMRLPKEFAELLFGVTKLGMTVVIADDKSQPEEVTHPGMVLGEYAAREFNAVDTAIKTAEYSAGHEQAPKSPSVVVSSADKSIHVFDNGARAASGKVEIQNPEKPLGERVFTLSGSDDQSGALTWQAAGVGAAGKTTGEDNGAALRRIKTDLPTREAVRKRLRLGTTLVTTDQPADAKTRSGDGFVVLDSQS
jgi:L,D-transpeptidase catalytic domain